MHLLKPSDLIAAGAVIAAFVVVAEIILPYVFGIKLPLTPPQ